MPRSTSTPSFGSAAAAGAAPGWGSRLGLVLFGLAFAAFGGAFIFLIAREVWTQAQTRQWMQVPCTVVESRVLNDPKTSREDPYRPIVRYRYTAGGGDRTSDAIELKPLKYSTYAKAHAVTERYPPGAATTCYVNPRDPGRSVLRHGGLWVGLFALLPLIFVLIGGAVIWYGLRGPNPSAAAAALTAHQPMSQSTGNRAFGTTLFFGFFLAVGIAVAFPTVILPAARMARARNWPAVPCTIVTSRVQVHHGDHSNSYSPDILYRYTLNGHEYFSSRYSAADYSTGSDATARAAVARYRPRSRATCYVNPDDPDESMLSRDWHGSDFLIALVPLVFIAVGGGGVFFSLRASRRRATLGQTGWLGAGTLTGRVTPTAWADGSTRRGSVTLRPRQGPVAKLAVAAAVAAFWNGIVSVFLFNTLGTFHGGKTGGTDVCGLAFLTPFVLIGIGLIVWLVYQFLALFNPRPELTLDQAAIELGGTAHLSWKFSGRYDRISRLRVTLEGREEATYRRGTTTTTDKRVFHRTSIADVTRPMDIAAGKGTLVVPIDTIHTFSAPNNRIVWELKLHGEIASWPDVDEAFPIQILPLPVGSMPPAAAGRTT